MNRRAFLGAIGVVLAAPAAALATKFHTEQIGVARWKHNGFAGWVCTSPNGETITGLEEIGGHLYMFTASAIYLVEPFPDAKKNGQ